jgi:hypothetical protein
MCRECWYRVPAKVRKAVNAAWRAYRRADVPEESIPAIRAYRGVREQAIKLATPFPAEAQEAS